MVTTTAAQQLEALVTRLVPRLRDVFLAAMQSVGNDAILRDVIRAIELGDLQAAYRAIGFNDAAMRPITKMIEDAFEQGGVTVGETFPKYLNTPSGRTVFRFDVRNSRAEAWLRENSSRLVVEIGEDVRQVVRNTVEQGIQAGNNPRNVALDLIGRIDPATGKRMGGSVGLTSQQAGWVARANMQLANLDPAYLTRNLRDKRFDGVFTRAIADGKPLPADVREKMVTRYRNRVLKYRGDTIARTEMLRALNQSEFEALKQAVDMGALQNNQVRRVWDNSGDFRVRPSHRLMEGQKVGLDEPFIFPGGGAAMYPGDASLGAPPEEVIQCRCKARTEVDWLANVSRVQLSPEERAALRALAD